MRTPHTLYVPQPGSDHNTATIRRTWNLARTLTTVRPGAPKRLARGAVSANQDRRRLPRIRGRSSMVERQLPKLHTRVRFPSPAPNLLASTCEADPWRPPSPRRVSCGCQFGRLKSAPMAFDRAGSLGLGAMPALRLA